MSQVWDVISGEAGHVRGERFLRPRVGAEGSEGENAHVPLRRRAQSKDLLDANTIYFFIFPNISVVNALSSRIPEYALPFFFIGTRGGVQFFILFVVLCTSEFYSVGGLTLSERTTRCTYPNENVPVGAEMQIVLYFVLSPSDSLGPTRFTDRSPFQNHLQHPAPPSAHDCPFFFIRRLATVTW